MTTRPMLDVQDIHKHFQVSPSRLVRAVDGVSFSVATGETLALVGESGCGKSTVSRAILRLFELTSGKVEIDGNDISQLSGAELRRQRRDFQMIFQDPFASLSPRETVGDIIGEPLQVHGITGGRRARRDKVVELLEMVGLGADHYDRYPFQFSGGQRQRIGIARAISVNPKLIVADEPVSALDVSIQSQVINLLSDLQKKMGVSYLFVAHDLAVVRHISHRVAVMYLGRIVEIADCDSLFDAPHHPYTQALLSAVPRPDPKRRQGRIVLTGDVPSPARIPSGCRFHTRCPIAQDICKSLEPPIKSFESGARQVACHFAGAFPIPSSASSLADRAKPALRPGLQQTGDARDLPIY